MNTTDRVEVLQQLYAKLAALITTEESNTYPVLEHLGDLIGDLESGE
jgi:hypothetical protein